MSYAYADVFVRRLADDIGSLIAGDASRSACVRDGLRDLTLANLPCIRRYWSSLGEEVGVPEGAFRGSPICWFSSPVARVFRTSGTTGQNRGAVAYSPLGLDLMNASILESAKRFAFSGVESPVVVRLVPDARDAPEMIMAYGMSLIAQKLGHPDIGCSVIGPSGIDFEKLDRALDAAVSGGHPVVLIGASFGIVNVCDALEKRGRRWQLPRGSRVVDAGGFKGRSRVVGTDDLRGLAERTFGIPRDAMTNLFGMTELASQLYDSHDVGVGPLGERPKKGTDYVWASLRDPRHLGARSDHGLVEVTDLCIIDRPHVVLSGDLGTRGSEGVAIVGRAERRVTRGCSLALEHLSS